MQWTIPGTTLQGERQDAEQVAQQFEAMFLPGGMMLSQVSALTGLEPYTVQNWVKRGFLSPPVKKRYSLRQLCRIVNINMLKTVLPMEKICGLLTYVNGQLDDESDDLIDDAELYFMFVRLAARAGELQSTDSREQILGSVLEDYAEPVPGAKERVYKVLRVMLTAWIAAQVGWEADRMACKLLEENSGKE